MSKAYLGIPAGVLDEDLEKHMTEKKGPFKAGGIGTESAELILHVLKKRLDKPDKDGIISHAFHLGQNDKRGIENAIRVLEAAGKVASIKGDSPRAIVDRLGAITELTDTILAGVLPDKEGGKK